MGRRFILEEITDSNNSNSTGNTTGCIIIVILLLTGIILSPGFIILSLFSAYIKSCTLSWIIVITSSLIFGLIIKLLTHRFFESSNIISSILYCLICVFCSIHIVSSLEDESINKSTVLLFPFLEKTNDNNYKKEDQPLHTIKNDNHETLTEEIIVLDTTEESEQKRLIQDQSSEIYYKIEDQDGYVNLRSAPSVNSEIVQKILSGEKVLFLSKSSNWIKVQYNDNIGYIHASRLVKS